MHCVNADIDSNKLLSREKKMPSSLIHSLYSIFQLFFVIKLTVHFFFNSLFRTTI